MAQEDRVSNGEGTRQQAIERMSSVLRGLPSSKDRSTMIRLSADSAVDFNNTFERLGLDINIKGKPYILVDPPRDTTTIEIGQTDPYEGKALRLDSGNDTVRTFDIPDRSKGSPVQEYKLDSDGLISLADTIERCAIATPEA